MSRLSIETPGRAQTVLSWLSRDMERRISASSSGLCPVDMSLNFLRLCHAQTCGVVIGAKIPVALTSRSDDKEVAFHSLAFCTALSQKA